VFIYCSPGGLKALVCAVDRAEHYHRPVKGTEAAWPSVGS